MARMSVKSLLVATFSLFTVLFSTVSYANDTPQHGTEAVEGHGEKDFDVTKTILEHIKDDHSWHLWGHTSIPLPVIVYSKERGLDVFMSSHFHHGEMAHKG
ncbi:MAG: F0F1 ATP synthase subunit A, partial [Sediminibacterium sp.]